jgi:arsenate reductase
VSKTDFPNLWRRLLAEYLGSLFLAAVVIGSGIAAQRLSPNAVGLELFENAAATAAGLFVIILMFGSVSGGHFNPIVSLVDAAFGGLSWSDACSYLLVQVAGCVSGAVVANLMFSRTAVSISTHARGTTAHALSEVVATTGLLVLIFALARTGRSDKAPAAVGRMFSNSFAGIAPSSVPAFVAAEAAGGVVAYLLIKTLYPGFDRTSAAAVTVVHERIVGDAEHS